MQSEAITGVVLAGGRATRMGGITGAKWSPSLATRRGSISPAGR